MHGMHARVLNDMLFAGVIYKNPTDPNDNLVRVRNGPELRRLSGLTIGQHEIELSVYGFADYFPDAPRPPVAGTRTSRVQVGARVFDRCSAAMADSQHRAAAARHRLSFRGDLSGWHLDISTPF